MLLQMPSGQFTGVVFNAAGLVSVTDANSAFMNGYSRWQVINYALTTPNWKLIPVCY